MQASLRLSYSITVLFNLIIVIHNNKKDYCLLRTSGLKRCGKSCRLRWLNYLRPELRHGGFTDEEDNLILSLYGEIGSKYVRTHHACIIYGLLMLNTDHPCMRLCMANS